MLGLQRQVQHSAASGVSFNSVSYLLTGRWLGVRCFALACPVRCVLEWCDSLDRWRSTREI
jgi:hypothetical protein